MEHRNRIFSTGGMLHVTSSTKFLFQIRDRRRDSVVKLCEIVKTCAGHRWSSFHNICCGMRTICVRHRFSRFHTISRPNHGVDPESETRTLLRRWRATFHQLKKFDSDVPSSRFAPFKLSECLSLWRIGSLLSCGLCKRKNEPLTNDSAIPLCVANSSHKYTFMWYLHSS